MRFLIRVDFTYRLEIATIFQDNNFLGLTRGNLDISRVSSSLPVPDAFSAHFSDRRGFRAAKTVLRRSRDERAAMLYNSRLENEATSAMCSRYTYMTAFRQRSGKMSRPAIFVSGGILPRRYLAYPSRVSAIACNDR